MNAPTEIMIVSLISALLPGGMLLLNERRLRRLSEARLMLAKAAIAADQLMLSGDTKVGDVCHDHVCRFILMAQHVTSFNVQWTPFMHTSKEEAERQSLLMQELDSNHGMRGIMEQFVRGFAKAFRNCHPFKFLFFSAWVLLFKSRRKVFTSWGKLKRLIAQWSVVLASDRILEQDATQDSPVSGQNYPPVAGMQV